MFEIKVINFMARIYRWVLRLAIRSLNFRDRRSSKKYAKRVDNALSLKVLSRNIQEDAENLEIKAVQDLTDSRESTGAARTVINSQLNELTKTQ